jgi:hypothetical protein
MYIIPDKAGDQADHPVADGYRIIRAGMSSYSVKARSYFCYKVIPHQRILRNAAGQVEYESYARMPIIPLAITRQSCARPSSGDRGLPHRIARLDMVLLPLEETHPWKRRNTRPLSSSAPAKA